MIFETRSAAFNEMEEEGGKAQPFDVLSILPRTQIIKVRVLSFFSLKFDNYSKQKVLQFYENILDGFIQILLLARVGDLVRQAISKNF